MKKSRKMIFLIIPSIVILFIILIIFIYTLSNSKINQTYNIKSEELEISTDQASIKRGKHLVQAIGKCQDCHANDLGGKILINESMIATIAAPNLTAQSTKARSPKTLNKQKIKAWVLAIRHGIRKNKSLTIMPSQEFFYFSDKDLGQIIAYIVSLPQVKRNLPNKSIGPIGRWLIIKGDLKLAALHIDNHKVRPAEPKPAINKEYGKYLVYTGACSDCHGDNYSGRSLGFAPPGTPVAPNLTPGGNLEEWSLGDFKKILRQGKDESGKKLNSFMPWKYTKYLTNDEIKAMFLYLKSLPRLKDGY